MNPAEEDIFTIQARRCKRCGGLLTSQQAVANGYGHTCLKKMQGEEEAEQPIPGQMDFFGGEGEPDSENGNDTGT